MSKMNKIAESLDLPVEQEDCETLPSTEITEMPDGVKESLKHNKKELNEIYRNAKQLLMNLINDAKDLSRPRDIEVLTEFMKETTDILRKIKDVDKDLIDVDNNGNGDNGDGTSGKINGIIFSGDTRDMISLIKHMKEKKETIIAEAREVKDEEISD